ncbi:PREDICTED: ubiquitin-conjugating enzyme E2 22-like isoform X2 [Tarenaya hassleriana]|uniref:ubiquitin-conjugating enzyme E2 22-like isoform X2 n=1 Tax=Tarenaya hassleriana TaxID=28532 RepID=UPI00053C8695|nr:PREDICTED: ubiquitin-conjugating enzyme E2 22-like isoform X2 [Tarenaya hassleriana]
MASNENLPPNVIKQLAKELKNLDESPPDGIKVVVNDEDFSTIYADIEGPVGTPYENGVFRMKLSLSHDFPRSPPKGYFLTKLFHPNIANNGEICVNTLKKDWNPSLGLRHVLTAGKMLLENYDEYSRHARLYTGIHAKPKPKFKTGAISESTTALNVDQTKPAVDQNDEIPNAANLIQSATSDIKRVITSGQDRAVADTVWEAMSAPANVAGKTVRTQNKEEGLAKKVELEKKKKVDARKRSLKRL